MINKESGEDEAMVTQNTTILMTMMIIKIKIFLKETS